MLKELTRAAGTASVSIQEVIEPCARKTGREVADASRGWKFSAEDVTRARSAEEIVDRVERRSRERRGSRTIRERARETTAPRI